MTLYARPVGHGVTGQIYHGRGNWKTVKLARTREYAVVWRDRDRGTIGVQRGEDVVRVHASAVSLINREGK